MSRYLAVLTLCHGGAGDTEQLAAALEAVVGTVGEGGLVRTASRGDRIEWFFDLPAPDLAPLVGRVAAAGTPDWSIGLHTVSKWD